MKILSIDPSIANIGWCLFFDNKPLESGTIHLSPEITQFERAVLISEKIRQLFLDKGINLYTSSQIVIETPDNWTRQGKNVGDLLKLMLAIGSIIGTANSLSVKVNTISVSQWKNTKSKIDKSIFEKIYPHLKRTSEHARDAVGLGEYWIRQQKLIERQAL